MPKISEEQIRQARSVDLLDYLRTNEPNNVRKSMGSVNEFYMVEHDSLKMSNGKWFRHSTQQGGVSALDFLIKVRGVHFVDAVQSLTDSYAVIDYKNKSQYKINELPQSSTQVMPDKPFTLPKPNRNNDRAVAYLRGRGIDKDIINRCIKAGILYESIYHRCVFVGKDDSGKARFAFERGISDDLKKDIAGSRKRYGFFLSPKEPDRNGGTDLALLESPVDALAHASIHEMGKTNWDGFRLSLGGVSSAALKGFLERHPNITDIHISLDNDKAGHDATNRIIKELLSDKRYARLKITITLPPIGKDYADTAKAIQQNSINKIAINRPKEAVF